MKLAEERKGAPGRGRHMDGMINFEKPKNSGATTKRLVKYIARSKWLIAALTVTVVFISLAGLASPYLQGVTIDILDVAAGNVDFGRLWPAVIMLAASYTLAALFTLLQGLIAAKLSETTVKKMRQDLFDHLAHLPIKFFDTHRHGDIMSRMTNDVETVSNTISQSIATVFSSVLTVIGVVTVMFILNWKMALLAFVTVPLSMLSTVLMGKAMRKYFKRQQELNGALNGISEEAITEYRTVASYSLEDKEIASFGESAEKLRKTAVTAHLLGGMMGPIMNTLGNINYIIIAATGGFFSVTSGMPISVIQSFLLYSKQFTRPINELGNQWATIQTAIAGAERIFAVIDTPVESDEGKSEAEIKGSIDFSHVAFAYKAGEPVLKDFDLKVEKGSRIAIVGKTGAGKTTVVNLLTRFYDIEGGSITIDGADLFDFPKNRLRKSIAIVLQDTVLFSDTVKNNIKYGRESATDEEIIAAAKLANAHSFIKRLPEGYDTVLSEAGANLSAGQRQLLSIARAIVADPKILILDEATSSVDTTTELHIQQAMLNLMQGRTSLIIAHRLSTIRDVDKIIVLENGAIAESGSHDELIKLETGRYRKLYMDQFAGIST